MYSDYLHDYECVCNEGLEGNGYNCEVEIVSCTKVDNCHAQATCTYDENLGKSTCICNPGFTGDGYGCTIIGKIYLVSSKYQELYSLDFITKQFF